MIKLFANSGGPDQMLHSQASDLGLHCLPVTLLGISRLQWINWPALQNCLDLFFLFFLETRAWHYMDIVSLLNNLHEMSNPIFSKKFGQIVLGYNPHVIKYGIVYMYFRNVMSDT